MSPNHKKQEENFWSGFSVGMVGGAVLLYLIGTRKGREILNSFIKYSDKMEAGEVDPANFLKTISQSIPETLKLDHKDALLSHEKNTFSHILDKIKKRKIKG